MINGINLKFLLILKNKSILGVFFFFLWLMMFVNQVHASLAFMPTRVIYPSDKREVIYRVKNVGDYPVILQAWVDDGASNGTPDESTSPFIVLPPVFKLEPNSERSLRIIYNKKKQADNKETLYWLNLYELPPISKKLHEKANMMLVTVKTQIKLFFRPNKLGTPPKDIIKELKISQVSQAGQLRLRVVNPLPFYITMSEITLFDGDSKVMEFPPLLIAPFAKEERAITEEKIIKSGGNKLLQFVILDDSGTAVPGKVHL